MDGILTVDTGYKNILYETAHIYPYVLLTGFLCIHLRLLIHKDAYRIKFSHFYLL